MPPINPVNLTPYIHLVTANGFPYPDLPYGEQEENPDDPTFVWTKGTSAGVYWVGKDGDVLLVHNSDIANPRTAQMYAPLNTDPDLGTVRTGEDVLFTIPAGGYAVFGPLPFKGYHQAVAGGGYRVGFNAGAGAGSSTFIYFAVLRFRHINP